MALREQQYKLRQEQGLVVPASAIDGVGYSVVDDTTAGAAKGLDADAGPVVAVVMGVLTAAAGGIIRDILEQETSIILRREIYVTASVIGAVIYVVFAGLGADRATAAVAGATAAFAIRGLAFVRGWSLPTYRPRPGRTADELSRLKLGGTANSSGRSPSLRAARCLNLSS